MERINYVEVSVESKDRQVITGLFIGINKHRVGGDHKNILKLYTAFNTYVFCNLANYSIKSVCVSRNKTIIQTFFKDSDEEKRKALEKILSYLDELRKDPGRVNEAGLVYINKYTNIPPSYGTEEEKTYHRSTTKTNESKTTSSSSNKTSSNRKPYIHSTSNSSSNKSATTNVYTNTVRKPTVIIRKSKLPTKAFLKELKEKLKAVKEGNYTIEIPDHLNEDNDIDKGNMNAYYRNWRESYWI